MKLNDSISWIVLNGPTSKEWINTPLPGAVWGCNLAYKDFDLTHLCLVDQPSIDSIAQDPPPCEILCRERGRRFPRTMKGCVIPGIDAGSFAFEQSMIRYPLHQHIIIGADGILGLDHITRYKYAWRSTTQVQQKVHKLHEQTFLKLIKQYDCNYVFVSNQNHKEFKTANEHTIRKTYLGLDAQHTE
tara:strand:+ start:584 stop:1144 length:561 start_codon:yes stop_codon:yes gene_type:complete